VPILDKITQLSRTIPWNASKITGLGLCEKEFSTDYDSFLRNLNGISFSSRFSIYCHIYKLYSQGIGSQFFLIKDGHGSDFADGQPELLRICNKELETVPNLSFTAGKGLIVLYLLFLHTEEKEAELTRRSPDCEVFDSSRICVVLSSSQINDTLALFLNREDFTDGYILRHISQKKRSSFESLPRDALGKLKSALECRYGSNITLDESI
jgi:hypothetical protein